MINVDPLFQLNTFIHMGLEYPDGSNIYPYLNREGYVIKIIGQKILVPIDNKSQIENHIEHKINSSVEPEIIYENKEVNSLILLECKVNGFNVDYNQRNTKQALGYLSCNNNHVQQYLGITTTDESNHLSKQNKIIYAVSNKDVELQKETLTSLSEVVQNAGVDNLPVTIAGIEVYNNDVYLNIVEEDKQERIKIIQNGNPMLINLIPIDPGINKKDPKALKSLQQKVSLTLSRLIGKNIGYIEFELKLKTLYEQSIPVWNVWSSEAQKHMKPLIKKYVREALTKLSNKGLSFDFDSSKQAYVIKRVNQETARKIRSYIITPEFLNLAELVFENTQLSFDDLENN